MAKEISEVLAEFVVQTGYNDLPGDCLIRAKHCFLDFIGVALQGSLHSLPSRLAHEYAATYYPEQQASVIGFGRKTSMPIAAFINSAMGHMLDFDDIKARIGHPSVTVIPALLAAGEFLGAGGMELLTAFILGVEVSCRIADWLEPEISLHGWHPTCIPGVLGVVTAVGKLLNLDERQFLNAFGMASGFASGLRRNFGSMTKPLQVGKTAESGVNAALFARMGITANRSIFSGENGFATVYSGGAASADFPDRLGKPFEVMDIGFKLYPCCASAHTAIDGAIALRNAESVSVDRIQNINVGTVPINIKNLIYSSPSTPSEAKFSMQFCLAVALLEGRVLEEHFSLEWINDPRVQRLMKNINTHHHPDLEQVGFRGTENSIIEIENQDGSTLRKRVDIPKGHPRNPLSEDELVGKYRTCSMRRLSEHVQEESIRIILNLEKQANLQPLMHLIAGPEILNNIVDL